MYTKPSWWWLYTSRMRLSILCRVLHVAQHQAEYSDWFEPARGQNDIGQKPFGPYSGWELPRVRAECSAQRSAQKQPERFGPNTFGHYLAQFLGQTLGPTSGQMFGQKISPKTSRTHRHESLGSLSVQSLARKWPQEFGLNIFLPGPGRGWEAASQQFGIKSQFRKFDGACVGRHHDSTTTPSEGSPRTEKI